jgi:hypothetical protein
MNNCLKCLTATPHFAQREPEKWEGETVPASVFQPAKEAIDPAERKELPASVPFVQRPADEIPSPVLVRQTFRLPERLIEELVCAGELRAFAWLDREGNTWLPIPFESLVESGN